MKKRIRSTSRVALIFVLTCFLLLSPNTAAFDGLFRASARAATSTADQESVWPATPFLNDTFENDPAGQLPGNWATSPASSDNFNFTVDNSIAFSGGKSARFFMNLSSGPFYPYAYRFFAPEQKGLTVVSFALRLSNASEAYAGLEISVDDDLWNGANIVFDDEMKIQYHKPGAGLSLIRDNYSFDRWYRVEYILNIQKGYYQIYLDDHLEISGAIFTGEITSVHRFAIRAFKFGNISAYMDQVIGYDCVRVPDDFATIQQAIDHAAPGQGVFVSPGRVYYESIYINKSLELIGSDNSSNRAVIDGRFQNPQWGANGITICSSSKESLLKDVQVHGFIIQNSRSNGFSIIGSNVRIYNNIINNTGADSAPSGGSGNGIQMSGFENLIQDNIITRCLNAGVYLGCANSTVNNNTISSNLRGVYCGYGSKGNLIYQNLFIGNKYQGLPESDVPKANKWNSSYPVGGNYWSDFESTDILRGPDQTEFGFDGICDKPRGNQVRGAPYAQDNYPLFLHQNVTQSPAVVHYPDTVTISGRVLFFAPGIFGRVYANFTYASQVTSGVYQVLFLGTSWTATIPAAKYGTEVQYCASIYVPYPIPVNSTNQSAWANATTCLKITLVDRMQYLVGDDVNPQITPIPEAQPQALVCQLINVTARIVEDTTPALVANASGIDHVVLSWRDSATGNAWNGTMSPTSPGSDNYSILVPKQCDNGTLAGTIYAYDKAGNGGSRPISIPVRNLANMVVRNSARNLPAEDPCLVDFEVLSRGAISTTSNVTITNTGETTLGWNLTYLEPLRGSWLTVTTESGIILPGNTVPLTIRVDTSGLKEPCNYVGKLWIQGNGTTSQWGLVVSVKTRYVVIDDAYGSSLAPDRCNMSDTENFGYHVIWAHDSSDATTGSLTIGINSTTSTAPGPKMVNGTGWAPWTYSSSKSANLAFPVTTASFTYVDPTNGKSYTITNFTVKATVLNTIWDRVNITIRIPDDRIDVGTDANPSVKAVYETDGLIFLGNVILSPTLYDGVSPNNRTGERIAGIPDNITAVDIIDPQYHLKAFTSNTVTCVWDRIRILAGGVSRSTVNVKETGTFWVIVVYEWDNQMFKGWYPSPIHMGQIFVDVYDGNNVKILEGVPMNWSSERERWECSAAFDSAGTRTFVVSGASDYQYGLSKVKNSVEPLSITWGQTWWNWWTLPNTQTSAVQTPSSNSGSEATWQQNPLVSVDTAPPLWVFIVAVLVISCISVTMLWFLGTKKNRRKRRQHI